MDDTTVELPCKVKDGVTFWPIPDFSGAEAAFGAGRGNYFPRGNLPKVPRKYTDIVDELFFGGGQLPEFAPGIDRAKAKRAISALLSSWEPSHESKIATVAYALWVWSTPEAIA